MRFAFKRADDYFPRVLRRERIRPTLRLMETIAQNARRSGRETRTVWLSFEPSVRGRRDARSRLVLPADGARRGRRERSRLRGATRNGRVIGTRGGRRLKKKTKKPYDPKITRKI